MRNDLSIAIRARRPSPARARARVGGLAVALLIVGACSLATRSSHAQGSGTQRPMPNVLLLVDTSGSMERMPDNSLPSDNALTTCKPGEETAPNRWGMLVQALTGNMQPFYSCKALDRSSTPFKNEFRIGTFTPYDTSYSLPFHRILSGDKANDSVCTYGPNKLPGGVSGSLGVGTANAAYSTGYGTDVTDFPDDAIAAFKFDTTTSAITNTACTFNQTPDGQLDAARDYVRFALMTFDNAIENEIGVNGNVWPPQGKATTDPFTGQWSYRRDDSNPLFGTTSTLQSTAAKGSAQGRPLNCPDLSVPPNPSPIPPFEVGARHWGAPPWEGRMVPFPASDATLFEIQKTNEQIQRVLLATRPFGATPIDGMLDDARDYFWYNPKGPSGDPFVKDSPCRDQYIILLTDGAPNLDLRPSCGAGAGAICPYPDNGSQIAKTLFDGVSGKRKVTTFVIGFSVNATNSVGDGFPAGYTGDKNCKSWYSAPDGGQGNPKHMADTACSPMPAEGTTAHACCMLNQIAYKGSGESTSAVGPFFAESQSDIVLAFGKILATVTKAVSTRTVPTYTPAAYSSSSFGKDSVTAQYLGSFIPNAQKPWSGEIARERTMCTGSTALTASPVTRSDVEGDSEAFNLAKQGAANRLYMTYVPATYTIPGSGIGSPPSTTLIDGGGTVRPYVTGAPDGIPDQGGEERAETDLKLATSYSDFRLALQIDSKTCKQGRVPGGTTGTKIIPPLNDDSGEKCTEVVWAFAAGHAGSLSKTGGKVNGQTVPAFDFNVRCPGSSAVLGKCSVSGKSCTLSDPTECTATGEPFGQVCVPECAPLGAVFRANLAISGPPDAVIRDAGYRQFQSRRSKRRPVLYAATTDGILHAFKAVEQATDADHELWSFVPPAVLPRLATNYPAGNQILLDGSPVVKDTVWDRTPSDLDASASTPPGAKWHTTLVAGLGVEGGGYYALNVTDPDCNAPLTQPTGACKDQKSGDQGQTGWYKASTLDEAGAGVYEPETGGTKAKAGPHFLWQLTDLPKASSGETAKVVRRREDGKERVSLFGRQTGTPAITTVQITTGSPATQRQIGVAILPGGIDGSPQPAPAECDRISTDAERVTDPAFPARKSVRQWATACDAPVAGRGVTIVRLDTGEIIKHFGREMDMPKAIPTSVRIVAPFDSPMIGTPVVYPQTVGAVAQKVYIGDADGTLWRLDISNSDSSKWKAELFADLVNVPGSSGSPTLGGAASQPVQIAPVLSLEPGGGLVINAATGDQENLIYRATEDNYVWSILETRPLTADPPKASVRWYQKLEKGQRVTGPMTVFDRTLYFASFAPRDPSTTGALSCENAGTAYLWGLSYYLPETLDKPSSGGKPMWCDDVAVDGTCNSSGLKLNQKVDDPEGFVIPGVTLRATQACSQINSSLGDGLGNVGFQSISPSSFQLSFGVSTSANPSSTLPPAAMLKNKARPLPRMATSVNAWAIVVD